MHLFLVHLKLVHRPRSLLALALAPARLVRLDLDANLAFLAFGRHDTRRHLLLCALPPRLPPLHRLLVQRPPPHGHAVVYARRVVVVLERGPLRTMHDFDVRVVLLRTRSIRLVYFYRRRSPVCVYASNVRFEIAQLFLDRLGDHAVVRGGEGVILDEGLCEHFGGDDGV